MICPDGGGCDERDQYEAILYLTRRQPLGWVLTTKPALQLAVMVMAGKPLAANVTVGETASRSTVKGTMRLLSVFRWASYFIMIGK